MVEQKQTKKVSIIIPVYNDEKYLAECLDSLLNQTLREIEIICTVDGSTDKSPEILAEYSNKDSRIFVQSQKNFGPGSARNRALEKAAGKYILFCDADDSLEPSAASECYNIMEQNSCDVLVFNTNIIEDGRSVSGLKNSKGEYISLVTPKNEGSLNKKACVKIMLLATIWGKMFRSDLIRRYSIRFTRHRIGEDARFLLSYLMIADSGWALNKTFYNYYLRQKQEQFHATYPWLGRFMRFPGIFLDVLVFLIRHGKPLRIRYFFYWLFSFFLSRKKHEK